MLRRLLLVALLIHNVRGQVVVGIVVKLETVAPQGLLAQVHVAALVALLLVAEVLVLLVAQ